MQTPFETKYYEEIYKPKIEEYNDGEGFDTVYKETLKKFGTETGGYLANSLKSAAFIAKGGVDDYAEFFESEGFFKAYTNMSLMNDIADEVPVHEIEAGELLQRNGFEYTAHKIEPKEGQALYSLYKQRVKAGKGYNSLHYLSAYDKYTNSLYITFPPSIGGEINGAAIGAVGQNQFISKKTFKYNQHGGKVYASLMNLYETTRPGLIEVMEKYPNVDNIVFSGHSQGGSLAQLAAGDEMFQGKMVSTFALGPAPVGDKTFFNGVKKLHGGMYDFNMIGHKNDVIMAAGDLGHYSNEMWDVSHPDLDPWNYEKMLSESPDEFVNASKAEKASSYLVTGIKNKHVWKALGEGIDKIRYGDFDPKMPKKGEFLKKGLISNIGKVLYMGDKLKIQEIYSVLKDISKTAGPKAMAIASVVLAKQTKNEKFAKIGQVITKMYEKNGYDLQNGKVVFKEKFKKAIKNFDAIFIKELFKKEKNVYKEWTDDMDKPLLSAFDEIVTTPIDEIGTEIDLSKLDAIQKSGNIVGDPSLVEIFGKEYDDILVDDDLYTQFENNNGFKGYIHESTKHLNQNGYFKLVDEPVKKPVLRAFTPLIYGAAQSNALKTGKPISRAIQRKIEIMKTNLDNLIKRPAAYQQLDDGIEVTRPTELTGKIKNAIGVSRDVFTKHSNEFLSKVIKSKGVANVVKFASNSTEITTEIVKNAKKFLNDLASRSSKYGLSKATMKNYLKKVFAKAIPVFGPALEVTFTSIELNEDLSRIENEKEYIIWNGEVVFKLYNPDEYEQLVALKFIYETNNLQDSVDYDGFVNTWYGRLESGKDGVLIIDGVRTDDPDFDIAYDVNVRSTRGEEYEAESKTLNVLKNVGFGIFNLAMDAATFVGIGSEIAVGLTIGMVDEIFEQQAISKKSNGFDRALKHKILNDTYNDLINQLMVENGLQPDDSPVTRKRLAKYIKNMIDANQTIPDPTVEGPDSVMWHKRWLISQGFEEYQLDNLVWRLNNFERAYGSDPDLLGEIVQFAPMTLFKGVELLGTGISKILQPNIVANTFTSIQTEVFSLELDANNLYSDIRTAFQNDREDGVGIYQEDFLKLIENERRKMASRSDEMDRIKDGWSISLQEQKELRKTDRAEYDRVRREADKKRLKGEELVNWIKVKKILLENWILNVKILDIQANPYASAYRDDQDVLQKVQEQNRAEMTTLMGQTRAINEVLVPLLKKHSGVGGTRDLEKEMLLAIKTEQIKLLLQFNGLPENHEIGGMLLEHWKNLNRDRFPLAEGEISIPIDIDAVSQRVQGVDDLFSVHIDENGNIKDSVFGRQQVFIDNVVRSQYSLISRVIDVFHDSRSIYKEDLDVVDYFTSNGIEIDFEKRAQMNIDEIVGQVVETTTRNTEFEIKNQYVDVINEIFKAIGEGVDPKHVYESLPQKLKIKSIMDSDGNVTIPDEMVPELFPDEKVGGPKTVDDFIASKDITSNKGADDATGSMTIQETDVLDEQQQFDHGLPDRDDKEDDFLPTGKMLPLSIDNGPPRMLFENGNEKSYIGPKNALAGGINQGYWTGIIPEGTHAPINTVDNFFMAYHIEYQEDEQKAKKRLIARLTKALQIEEISMENNLVEYNIAIYTMDYLKRHDNLFGLEISNEFMRNGLGATLNAQIKEELRSQVRKGKLPDNFNPKEYKNMEIEKDVKNPLKRAADFADEIGDKFMATKFRKISMERDDMERVANEYIGELRKSIGDGVNLGGGLDRLTLEKTYQSNDLGDKYVQLIVESLGKPLISFI